MCPSDFLPGFLKIFADMLKPEVLDMRMCTDSFSSCSFPRMERERWPLPVWMDSPSNSFRRQRPGVRCLHRTVEVFDVCCSRRKLRYGAGSSTAARTACARRNQSPLSGNFKNRTSATYVQGEAVLLAWFPPRAKALSVLRVFSGSQSEKLRTFCFGK